MSKSNRRHRAGNPLPAEVIEARMGLYTSGAAGVHADQKVRVHRAGATRRIGSRSARTRSAIRFEES